MQTSSGARRIVVAAGAVFSGLFVGYVIYILVIAGTFRDIEPHFDGTCTSIPGAVGAEDIVITADGTTAFISSNDRAAGMAGKPSNGAIYAYDLTRPDAKPMNVTPNVGPTFAPHGIGLWEGEKTVLFVVNHPGADVHGDLKEHEGARHTVEIFDVEGTTLTHRQTVAGELLITPNDVAPVGPDTFYVTNDHGTGDKFWRKVEDYTRQFRSHVLFWDGAKFTRLPGEYGYANGIAASRDGEEIYVAAPTQRAIHVFRRNTATNGLTRVDEIFVDTAPDNVSVDTDGNLWIGAHPKMFELTAHMKDPTKRSPSQVLRVTRDGDAWNVHEIMLTDGTDLSGSTTAVRHGDRMLVGSVFEPVFLDCRLAAR